MKKSYQTRLWKFHNEIWRTSYICKRTTNSILQPLIQDKPGQAGTKSVHNSLLNVIFCPWWTNIHSRHYFPPHPNRNPINTKITLTLTVILTVLTITIHEGWKIAWSWSNYPSLGMENIYGVIFCPGQTNIHDGRYFPSLGTSVITQLITVALHMFYHT